MAKQSDDKPATYYLKSISNAYGKGPLKIVTQNENGPCPLISLINCCILKGFLTLNSKEDVITSSYIIELLATAVTTEYADDNGKKFPTQNIAECLKNLSKLENGVNVSPKFEGVKDFLDCSELASFKIFDIHIYHGWIVPPNNMLVKNYIGQLSYEEICEKMMIEAENGTNVQSRTATKQWMLDNSAQITDYGLSKIRETMMEEEIAVLFRNNHFSTITKSQGKLVTLVTDQGYLDRQNIVWETLSVTGAGMYLNHQFQPIAGDESLSANNYYSSDLSALERQEKEYEAAAGLMLMKNSGDDDIMKAFDEDPTISEDDKIAVKQAQQEFILTRKQEEEDYSYAKALELEEATRQENMNVAKAMEILQKEKEEEELRNHKATSSPSSSSSNNCTLL